MAIIGVGAVKFQLGRVQTQMAEEAFDAGNVEVDQLIGNKCELIASATPRTCGILINSL